MCSSQLRILLIISLLLFSIGFGGFSCQILLNETKWHMLQVLVNNLISVGLGREAAFAAAVLGDNALMEKAWQDTGMLAEAVLHAHV